jgi:two-component system chemotaxis response regulator CheY
VARVLIVDDAGFMRMMLRKIIVVAGHEVVAEAADGETAVTAYKEVKPDLTTLDITMPGKDGITVLREILEFDPHARVVMCSALGQQAKVVESIKLGAKDFVVKPFEADAVRLAIENALATTA